MEVVADRVAVTGTHGPLLAATSLRVGPGELAVVAGDPYAGHTAFGLALTGRIAPSAGSIAPKGAELRKRSVLIDAPGVTEPEPGLSVGDVITEELALSRVRGRKSHRLLLDRYGLDPRDRFESVAPAVRTALLADLAKPGTDLLVLDTPDRHTADTADWWPTALAQAQAGRAVVVLCGTAAAERLPLVPARLGEHFQPAPLEMLS
ncbi:hypothetical protein [Alloactinosynnema sp. L-07]|uniref:ABC transporter ATP-binding protein n=1 Tax=Alloactinosynnema sp. L-07 TaxID=1653480 RepID=UPI00065F0A9E|nr:ABC transporter ATP-binding protein [Alloactinosynnema sp. L-07]CRK56143.1 hypothetical protein [Alloactinosynnema sp. L-07]